MLLSMFISFVFARRFRWKKYVALVAVIVPLVSLLSVLPYFEVAVEHYHLLPMSFPFHARIGIDVYYKFVEEPPYLSLINELYFLTFKIGHIKWECPQNINPSIGFLSIIYLPFLLINLVGAIFGYWISKSTFIEKLLKKR